MSVSGVTIRRLVLGVVLALALPAPASAFTFTFTHPFPHQEEVQRALSYQVNAQVAVHWQGISHLHFGPGGIPITFPRHGSFRHRTMVLSAEILQWEINPSGRLRVVEPVFGVPEWILGQELSDFTWPAYWHGTAPPFDQVRLMDATPYGH